MGAVETIESEFDNETGKYRFPGKIPKPPGC
jgi:hypothetical protein